MDSKDSLLAHTHWYRHKCDYSAEFCMLRESARPLVVLMADTIQTHTNIEAEFPKKNSPTQIDECRGNYFDMILLLRLHHTGYLATVGIIGENHFNSSNRLRSGQSNTLLIDTEIIVKPMHIFTVSAHYIFI